MCVGYLWSTGQHDHIYIKLKDTLELFFTRLTGALNGAPSLVFFLDFEAVSGIVQNPLVSVALEKLHFWSAPPALIRAQQSFELDCDHTSYWQQLSAGRQLLRWVPEASERTCYIANKCSFLYCCSSVLVFICVCVCVHAFVLVCCHLLQACRSHTLSWKMHIPTKQIQPFSSVTATSHWAKSVLVCVCVRACARATDLMWL